MFISYAREDASGVALQLQHMLEHVRIPRKLVGKGVPLPQGKYLRRVFVDTEDLPVASTSFRDDLIRELDDAEFLIVLCSKASARLASFVHQEIDYFIKKEKGDTSRILPIALDGIGETSIPREVQQIVENRNIVIWDRRWDGQGRTGKAHKHTAFFKVLEFLLGVDAGVLNNRYWIAWRRKMIGVSAFVFSFLLALVVVLAHDFRNQTHRVMFEKKVFPLSIDYSYMEAFAAPLVGIETNRHNVIIAAMPKNYAEIGNKPGAKKEAVKRDLVALGWTYEERKYSKKGWSRPIETAIAKPNGTEIIGTNVFVDVVSQLSAIKKVLDYLTEDNPFHSIDEREELASYYVEEFKAKLIELMQENETLKGSSWEFKFVTDKTELKAALDSIHKSQESR